MKSAFLSAAAISVLLFLLALLAGTWVRASRDEDKPAPQTQITEPSLSETLPQVSEEAPQVQSVMQPKIASFDCRFRLPVLTDEGVVSMELSTYVLGALLGEMPTSFEAEALKAQAVACRTYALRRYTARKHDPAAVCTDAGCCMNWRDPAQYAAENGEEALRRAEAAVEATDGLAIYHDGTLIDATFFSSSGGRTEAASAVWGKDVPYLQAVDSPDEQSPHDKDVVTFSFEDFTARLCEANEMAAFPADRSAWIGACEPTPGGGVATIELGGCIYTGKQLRQLFSLRSTAFSIQITDSGVEFTTRGFGHRVGMSQYGANAMARRGAGFEEILQWYYQGVVIKKVEDS